MFGHLSFILLSVFHCVGDLSVVAYFVPVAIFEVVYFLLCCCDVDFSIKTFPLVFLLLLPNSVENTICMIILDAFILSRFFPCTDS